MQQKGALEPVTLMPLNEALGFGVFIASGTAPREALGRERAGLEQSIRGTLAREGEAREGQNAHARNQRAGGRGSPVPRIQDPWKMSPIPGSSNFTAQRRGGGASRASTRPLLTCTSRRVSGNTFAILEDICCCREHSSFFNQSTK